VLASILPAQTLADMKKNKYDELQSTDVSRRLSVIEMWSEAYDSKDQNKAVEEDAKEKEDQDDREDEMKEHLISEQIHITPHLERCIARLQACVRRRMAKNEYHKLCKSL